MSDFIHSSASVRLLLKAKVFFYRQRVQMYDMGDKSKTMAFFLSCFWHIPQRLGCSLQRNKTAQEGSQTSQWCCHATMNEMMIPYMTQCKDPEIINQSKTISIPQQCLSFYRASSAKGLLSCTLLMGLKLNTPLFPPSMDNKACVSPTWRGVVSGGGGEQGQCDSPRPILQQEIHPSH